MYDRVNTARINRAINEQHIVKIDEQKRMLLKNPKGVLLDNTAVTWSKIWCSA